MSVETFVLARCNRIHVKCLVKIQLEKCVIGPWLAVLSQRDYSNSMGFNEFKELSQVLNGWRNTFASYDRDRSGTVEGQELQQALSTMGMGKNNLLDIL